MTTYTVVRHAPAQPGGFPRSRSAGPIAADRHQSQGLTSSKPEDVRRGGAEGHLHSNSRVRCSTA
jgi:hypothetical protein